MANEAKKILIVDDDPDIVSLVTKGLGSAGFEVVSARDGEEGLYVAKAVKPAVVLLDVSMPRIHGFEVLRRIRADADLAHARVIMTTAKNYQSDRRDAETLGADLYLVKPYGLKDLVDAIHKLLGVG